MIFTRAAAADIPALTELRLAYLAEDFGALADAEAESFRRALPGYFRENLDRRLLGYVAREGGAAVACALLLLVDKPMSPAFPNGRTGTVLNVYTRPAWRRRGCARRLMEMLLADAKERGLCRIELKATAAGAPLYRSLGFTDDGDKYSLLTWRNPCAETPAHH